jgi:hypothetical protein
MADTTDRQVVHYMIRSQHPKRADCWLLEFLAPAVAIKLAVTKEEWGKFIKQRDPSPTLPA